MKSLYDESEFIPWPSFTDLTVSILLILILFIFTQFVMSEDALVKKEISEIQDEIINDFKREFRTDIKEDSEGIYTLDIDNDLNDDIFIKKEATLLRIRFTDLILFDIGQYELKSKGKDVLRRSGNIFKNRSRYLKEINVQGHTDNIPIKMTNWKLSTLRALEVLDYWLNDGVKLDAQQTVVSASGFGEYLPASVPEEKIWNRKITDYNSTEKQRRLNRRIEIVLTFPEKLELLEKRKS